MMRNKSKLSKSNILCLCVGGSVSGFSVGELVGNFVGFLVGPCSVGG